MNADIIPGDSGGALLESDGDVVGMNVAASSGSADITGYVIPIKRVLRIAARVVAGEETASDAGLDARDTITSLGGASVTTYLQLQEAVPPTPLGNLGSPLRNGCGQRSVHDRFVGDYPDGGWRTTRAVVPTRPSTMPSTSMTASDRPPWRMVARQTRSAPMGMPRV